MRAFVCVCVGRLWWVGESIICNLDTGAFAVASIMMGFICFHSGTAYTRNDDRTSVICVPFAI